VIHEQFGVYSSESQTERLVDLIRFSWTEAGAVEAWAIECKPGNRQADVMAAVAQACEYQVSVPRVSIAAETPTSLLRSTRKVLERLGLGYVVASSEGASIEIPAEQSPLLLQDDWNLLQHAGALCLIAPGLGDGSALWVHSDVRRSDGGRKHATLDRPSWGLAVHPKADVQIILSLRADQDPGVKACVWVQKKRRLEQILEGIDASKFHDALAAHGLAVRFSLRRVAEAGGRLEPEEGSWGTGRSKAEVTEALKRAQRAVRRRDRRVPIIEVPVSLWSLAQVPTRTAAHDALQKARTRLDPVRVMLAAVK
jgi:hypothetical protein